MLYGTYSRHSHFPMLFIAANFVKLQCGIHFAKGGLEPIELWYALLRCSGEKMLALSPCDF